MNTPKIEFAKVVDKTIPMYDYDLKHNIIFDEELLLNDDLSDIYTDNRVRVQVAKNNDYYAVSATAYLAYANDEWSAWTFSIGVQELKSKGINNLENLIKEVCLNEKDILTSYGSSIVGDYNENI